MKICCFTGHRPADMPFAASESDPDFLTFAQLLKAAIRRQIDQGSRQFITGMCVGMDLWAALAVLQLKAEHPDLGITLTAAVPHPGQEQAWPEEAKHAYRYILERCDQVHMVSDFYFRGVMMVRNHWMVDHSDTVIAALRPDRCSGGTWSTVQYALKKKKEVVNIFGNSL